MEDEIKVGEYVRTDSGIGKVIKLKEKNINFKYIVGYGKKALHETKERIKKHSFNIIDLIEVDDLIYYKVRSNDKIHKNFVVKNYLNELQVYFYSMEQIEVKAIITKEQFKDVEYIV